MNNEYIISLYNARTQFGRYISIPVWLIGVLSEICSIIVFLSLETFRQNSCSFYLLFMSIFSLIRLLFSTSLITISIAFTINWQPALIFYCEIRNFVAAFSAISATTMLCSAIIDQYFATCNHPRWQRWSNIKLARRITFIVTLIWMGHAIVYSIYFRELSPANTAICIPSNLIFLRYDIYGNLLTIGNILPLIAVIFGILSYRNARTLTTRINPLVRRELDKQLTSMVLVQICVYICTYLPYMITNGFLSLYMSNDRILLAQMNLINAIVLTWNIFTNGSSFYTYIFVSKRFRRQAKYVLYEIYMNRFRQNRIDPIQIVSIDM
ncbi:unnamed protein product [Adineta ricciae]|uniref:G-protein coupled receptors family 1 profile domain-containing protein n=1 Tax=Adineta ricciae TaxID=249248 RepID=A0A815KQJ6_ADIRI|nr:unnamed protein product [Adineta ricciae]CAF1480936.1 unnamed protein product [Adineta ricciae]